MPSIQHVMVLCELITDYEHAIYMQIRSKCVQHIKNHIAGKAILIIINDMWYAMQMSGQSLVRLV